MACVISIVNQKGGVGKTTTAVNLATCLAAAGYETLLVDLDPQGNATSGVGVDSSELDCSIYEALTAEVQPQKTVVQTFIPRLSIIPSNIDLSGAEITLLDHDDRLTRLRAVLEPLDDRYRFILIDSPPSLSVLALNALAATKHAIVPVQCEYYALEGLSTLLPTFERVRESVNPDIEILGILMTMHDRRTNLSQQVVSEVRRVFGPRVFNAVIPRSVKLSEAPSFGQPAIIYDVRSAGSQAYMEFCQEVLDRV